METLQDLIEEAKVRFLWWGLAIFAVCYFLSHTSKSMWMNVPISVLLAFALRTLLNNVEFRWKPPQSRRQTYLSYLEKKQLSVKDPRLSTALPPQRWKRKIDSPVVQEAAEEFINLIVKDFVTELWYSDITPDKEAPELICGVIMDALGEVAGRVKEVNLVDLLTRDMIDLVGDHIEMYRRNQASIGVDVMGTLSSEERDERLKHHLMASKELHPALVSPESEYKYLQQLMGGVIALVLRQREVQCPLVRSFAREFLTCLVIQPLLNLASPVCINELIEFIVLNFDDVMNKTEMEGGNGSSKVHHNRTNSVGTADIGQSNLEKYVIPHTQQSDMALAKVGDWREKVIEVSVSSPSTSHEGIVHPKTADWAKVLDAATQRRTEVLAPENLENMWAKGRNYKNKLNRASRSRQVTGKVQSISETLSNDTKKPKAVEKDANTVRDDKATVQVRLGSTLTVESTQIKDDDEPKLSHSLAGESTSRGPTLDDINHAVDVGVHKTRLKRSSSTSVLKIEPDEKRANTNENRGIIISEEFYSPGFGKPSIEHGLQSASDEVMHAEVSCTPKLRCRVIGAYFEKIGSKSFAVYSIAVTDSENNTWFVKRRYRNFERLHRHLKDIPNYTLHLPPKRIFSSSTEDAFVHQRCIQLDKYLQDLLSIANVAEQHEVWDFLSVSSKSYSFGKSPSVMKTLAVNVDDAVDDIVRQFKGVSDGLMRKVVGPSPSQHEASQSMPVRYVSWNADEIGSQVSGHSSIERANSSSDNEEDGVKGQDHAWHSDNEIDAKDFHPLMIKQVEEPKSMDFNKYDSKSEWTARDRSTSLPSTSANLEDPVGVPPEWSPPNVSVPALNLVDKIFQLNKRGWLRRQVFWISKQILQLVMEDAIDDWLLGQINWLRKDDVIAQGIRWIKNTLWPDGKFFIKIGVDSEKSEDSELQGETSQTTAHAKNRKVSPSGTFEAQLEAARRASDVKKLLLNGAPSTLVSLIGQKQYKRCARDIYYFLQSSICIKQLAYGGLELVIISVFPELRELIVDTHKKMRRESGSPA